MHLHRSVILPILLSGAVGCAVLYPATAVHAKANAVPTALVQRVFSAESIALTSDVSPQAPAANALPEGKGKDIALKNCTTCHASNAWTSQHHTKDQWNSILDNMVSKGLSATDDELDSISEYLTTNFGPVAKAPAAAPAAPPATQLP